MSFNKKNTFSRSIELLGLAGKMIKAEVLHHSSDKTRARIEQAEHLAKSLGQLKGAAMKLGQMVALEARDILPDEVVVILESLQSSAPPMPFETIENILLQEWGLEKKNQFHIEPQAFAAASIGQVHRAVHRTKDGSPEKQYVIKVQYPGIANAIDADVKLLKYILSGASLVTGKTQTDYSSFISEVQTMFYQEVDYQREAQNTIRYKKYFANSDYLIVPEVLSDFSTKHVLTLDYHQGVSVTEAVRQQKLSADQKHFFAEKFLEIYIQEFCQFGFVQTDPNLGNFLLQPDNMKLVALDFGATREYPLEFRKSYSQLIFHALSGEREKCIDLALKMQLLDPRESQQAKNTFYDLMVLSMTTFKQNQYDFRENTYSDQMRVAVRKLILELKYSPPPRDLIFLHRKLGGLFQILRRLEVQISLQKYLVPFESLAQGRAQPES